MRHANLRNFDLNLLLSFQVLIEERNITRAAKRMYISQPAMSRIVDRLQAMFGDELLVRTPEGYEPTQRALEIRGELQELLPKIEGLFHHGPFDPSSAAGVFRVETVDWGATVLLPELVAKIENVAPLMKVDILPRRGQFDRLEANEVDLVVAGDLPSEGIADKGLRSAPLVNEKWVCVMRSGNPLAKGPLTLEKYLGAKHVVLQQMQEGRRQYTSTGMPVGALDRSLASLGGQRDVRLRTPYFIPVGAVVENTDLIATVPLHISRWLKTPKTKIVPAPEEIPGYTIRQFWHMRNDSAPLQRWLREILSNVADQITAGTPFAPEISE
jgi:DNA-binding transcriptional LysR family regulator